MSQANISMPGPVPGMTRRGVGLEHLIFLAALLLLAGGLLASATVLDVMGGVADSPRLPPAPSALPVAVTSGSTTVPDASAIFAGREMGIEEPVPTF